MGSYKIIGADRNEYGPVSEEQLQKWIADGRANAETPVLVEGELEWKRLGDLPGVASPAKTPELAVCPGCGEPFEKGFDSCWKCGTGRDGSPPESHQPVIQDQSSSGLTPEQPCPKCGSRQVVSGRLLTSGDSATAIFRPENMRLLSFSFLGGVRVDEESLACLDCGLIWGHTNPQELRGFISTHCRQ